MTQIHRTVSIVFFLLLIAVFIVGAYYHATHVNTDMGEGDQMGYMRTTEKMHASQFQYLGDRNRMPLYSMLQLAVYRPGMGYDTFFYRGKCFNIALSVIVLAALFIIFRTSLGRAMALNLFLVVAFGVLIFRAGYFQSEVLFYFLVFVSFFLSLKLLSRPSFRLAILTGIVIGLAHLTKGAVLPAMVLVSLNLIARLFFRRTLRDFLYPMFVIICFITTVFPYEHQSKQIFGRYFYNVNSTFYMWTDTREEAYRLTRAHGDRKGWPDMPEEFIPSPQKYLREHSLFDMGHRILKYGKGIINECLHSYGYQWFVLAYMLFALIASVSDRDRTKTLIHEKPALSWFVGCYFCFYFILYAWFGPLELGNRLVLQQFIPFMFVLAWFIDRSRMPSIRIFHGTLFCIFLMAAWPMTRWLMTTYSGR